MPTTVTCPGCGLVVPPGDRFCGACGTAIVDPALTSGDGSRYDPWSELLQKLRQATVGEYEIRGELGRGGMAAVFLAQDLQLNRKVAIKVMLPGLVFGPSMWERFLAEARTAAKLDHPNIIYIHSVREKEHFLYFVMKYVDGRSLDDILLHSETLPVAVAQTILVEVARALEYAHREGVVHRDVKPANIMIDQKGNSIVMDFGIARAADDRRVTQSGATVGTPAYMSPEQCRGNTTTAASDQYSLGALAYELLAGVPPFSGTPIELQIAHMQDAPRPLRDLRPELSLELSGAVMRMLSKNPMERWTSLKELIPVFGRGLDADDPGPREYLMALARTPSPARKSFPELAVSTPLVEPAAPALADDDRDATPVTPVPAVASPSVASAVSPREISPDIDAVPAAPPRRRWRLPLFASVAAAAALLLWLGTPSKSRGTAAVRADSADAPLASNLSRDATVTDAAAAVEAALGDSAVVGRGADATTRVHGKIPRTVVPEAISLLSFPAFPSRIAVGDTLRVRLEAQDDSGAPVTTPQVVWTTSSPRVARFLEPGLLLAVREGTATITVAAGQASTKRVLQIEARGPALRRPPR